MVEQQHGEEEEVAAKTVLVAIDESKGSTEALQWALDNVVCAGKDRVELVTVKPSYSPSARKAYAQDSLEETKKKEAEHMLGKYQDMCRAREVECSVRVVIGDARLAICEAVEEANADALVVGSRGHGLMKRLVLGSVSEYCVHNCACPVLVVRPNMVGTPETIAPVE